MFRRTAKANHRTVSVKERLKYVGSALVAAGRYIGPLIVLAAVTVGVPIGIFFGYQHVVSTPYFALDDVHVRGLVNLEESALLRQADVVRGANAFDVDPERVELLLTAMPWIRKATVTKRLPKTLEIVVEERIAAAVLVDGGSFSLVDQRAEPFKEIEGDDPVDRLLKLPLITGLSRAEAEAAAGQQLVLEALEVVRLAQEYDLPTLSEVHVDPVMGLSIVPSESGVEIRLGRGRYTERLERLRAVFAALARDGREVDYILIDNEQSLNRVTVGSRAMDRGTELLGN